MSGARDSSMPGPSSLTSMTTPRLEEPGVRPHARRSVAVTQGVFDEGGQDLPEFAGVGQDRALGLVEEDERAPGEGELVLPFLAGGIEDFEDVDRLGPSAAFAFGDVQEFGDDVRHALDLFEAGAGLGAHLLLRGDVLDLFEAHRQGRERGPQLVGGIGGGLALGGEAPGHALTRARELLGDQVDLFDAGLLDAGAHPAGSDLLGLGGQVDEGGGQGAGQRSGHEPADQHRSGHPGGKHAACPRDARDGR